MSQDTAGTDATASLDQALQLARAGYYLAPVTLRRVDGERVTDYHKLSWDHVSTRDEDQLRAWTAEYPDCSFLVDTGKSGVVAVDLDVKHDHDGITNWQLLGGPRDGMIVETLTGGEHHYFRADPDRPLINSRGQVADGIDVRAEGGHVYAPGARIVGEDGEYRVPGSIVGPAELPPAPEVLHERRKATSPNAGKSREDRLFTRDEAKDYCRIKLLELRQARPGGRNDALNVAAFRLGHFISDEFNVSMEAAAEWVRTYLPPGYGDAPGEPREIEATIRSGLTDGVEDGVYVRKRVESESAVGDEDEVDEYATDLAAEVRKQDLRADATRLRTARDAEPLRVLDFAAFLASPMLEPLVPGFLYRDSLSKVFGSPGGTKSYLLLDLALHLATGRTWHGRELRRTRVHYVMAEGQAVNLLRTLAWMAHHGVNSEDLFGYFTAIPQGILLTPEGIGQYLDRVKTDEPGLVVLDTKNAMMDGDENSPSDAAVMIRAMRAIRDASSGGCVSLVDHTGLLDQSRGRGTNAVMAAMDTEIRVSRDLKSKVATAEVTRDKAGEPGTRVAYTLLSVPDVDRPPGVPPPAVCVPHRATDLPVDPVSQDAYHSWADPDRWQLPDDVLVLAESGLGKEAIPSVARYMRVEAGDRAAVGRTRAEAVKHIAALGVHSDKALIRAWDRLVAAGRVANLNSSSTSKTAASHWQACPGDPEPRQREGQ